MPILFVVKRSRARLLPVLKRHLEKPGLLVVLLDRRTGRERRRHPAEPVVPGDRRRLCRRQPLDLDAARTWVQLGFLVRKVRALPELAPSPARSRARAAARSHRPRRRAAVRHRAR